ncbi:prepilin peptidase [Bombilactobacillus thymidiniphilus]|uniref:Prepilin peptidase n=1 Tax=Bombilactobacillus thymidiniphilus TaxID=2923363 RepID=A0ABY4PEF0_9LACO|nr:A24 family peptidase [Bombilactobacillus thymidiniphilus]UQS84010.1 prepilin peptidase [Bombilactobacillus thymidiniphilus]
MIIFNIIFSICCASFSGLVAIRLPKKRPIITGRSYCDFCHTRLKWYHEIPIISYLFLRGRCHFCKHKINIEIFIIEIIGLIIGWKASQQTSFSPYILIILTLSVTICALTDWRNLAIWPITLIPIVTITLVLQPLTVRQWLHWLLLAIIFNSIYWLMPNKLGYGDIEVILVIALVLGIKRALLITLGATSLAMCYLVIQTSKRTVIPFIPFFLASLLIDIIFLL